MGVAIGIGRSWRVEASRGALSTRFPWERPAELPGGQWSTRRGGGVLDQKGQDGLLGKGQATDPRLRVTPRQGGDASPKEGRPIQGGDRAGCGRDIAPLGAHHAGQTPQTDVVPGEDRSRQLVPWETVRSNPETRGSRPFRNKETLKLAARPLLGTTATVMGAVEENQRGGECRRHQAQEDPCLELPQNVWTAAQAIV
jgi:hypothetical protein